MAASKLGIVGAKVDSSICILFRVLNLILSFSASVFYFINSQLSRRRSRVCFYISKSARATSAW